MDIRERGSLNTFRTIGFKHAGYEIDVDVLKRAQSLDENKLREAIAQTDDEEGKSERLLDFYRNDCGHDLARS